jgi:hypothetical protein
MLGATAEVAVALDVAPKELTRTGQLPLTFSPKEATRRAYRSDWMHFTAWCEGHRAGSLPASPDTVAAYLTDLANTHKVATIVCRLAQPSTPPAG